MAGGNNKKQQKQAKVAKKVSIIFFVMHLLIFPKWFSIIYTIWCSCYEIGYVYNLWILCLLQLISVYA